MASYYAELRPAYTGEENYSAVITIDGSGTIAGQTFAGEMYDPDGAEAEGTVTATVTDAAAREVTLTLPGQDTAGLWRWVCRRTDDSSNLVVAHGVIELTDPAG